MDDVREKNTTAVLNALHFLLFTMSKSMSKHLVLLDVLKSPKIILAHH